MTNPQYEGTAIVIAGYPREIRRMLKTNPGFESRFRHTLELPDWRPAQCVEFLTGLAKGEGLDLPPDLRPLEQAFAELSNLPNWANCRDVKSIWTDILSRRSRRVVNEDIPSRELLQEELADAAASLVEQRRKSEAAGKNQHFRLPEAKDQRIEAAPKLATKESKEPEKPVVKQQEKEKKKEKEAEPEEEREPKPKLSDIGCDGSKRDPGVSDELWADLEKAKQRYQEKQERIRLELLAAEEAARKAKDEAERKAAEKRREELLAKQRADEESRKRVQEQIRRLCPCPAGFSWTQVGGGWRCAGGAHFVSDAQLRQQYMH